MKCRPEPADPALYARIQRAVQSEVRRWPSAYASGLVVQRYKAAGGEYEPGCPRRAGGLTQWFNEQWVDVCRPSLPACGRRTAGMTKAEYRRAYPKCRPLAVAQRMTPAERAKSCRRKRAAVSRAGERVVWVRDRAGLDGANPSWLLPLLIAIPFVPPL